MELDTTTIVAETPPVEWLVWTSWRFAKPHPIGSVRTPVHETRQQVLIDCALKRSQGREDIFYDGDGTVLRTYHLSATDWHAPAPDTLGEQEITSVCLMLARIRP